MAAEAPSSASGSSGISGAVPAASASCCVFTSSSLMKPMGFSLRFRNRTDFFESANICSAVAAGTSECSICAGSGRSTTASTPSSSCLACAWVSSSRRSFPLRVMK